MKRIFVAFLSLGLFLSSCSDNSVPESQSINVSADFSAKSSAFAFDFWKAYEAENGGSYFLSPLSLNIALGMLLNGADGDTRAEIKDMLGFDDSDIASVNATYKELITKLPNIDPAVTNVAANSVWHANDFEVKDAYLNELKDSFLAKVYAENFADAATVAKINQWASDNTNAKITKILEKIEPSQVLFLINALYFKGDWAQKFNKDNTFPDTFKGESKTSTKDFMNQLAEFPYYENEEFQMLEMPYGNDKYTFVALLPKSGTVGELVQNMSESKWNTVTKALNKTKVEVSLPKFGMETSKDLSKVLASLGMKKAFTTDADLSNISGFKNLLVGFVKQDTYLSVDEQGSEAAAVTTIGVELTSVPSYPSFRCNKPFIFAIVEKTSNTLQFIGKVTDL